MQLLTTVIGFFITLLATAHGNDCTAGPLTLPIKDVQVYPDVENSFMRGIHARIGTPAQDIVLLPWVELNNTWVYDDQQAYCNDTFIWSSRMCRVRRGHLFQASESTTFEKANNMAEAGGASVETKFDGSEKGIDKLLAMGISGTDVFRFGDLDTIEKYPVGIPTLDWDSGYTTLHALGMGSNSTFLNALRSSGKISSRVWSIFWGRMWRRTPLDGSIILGGYDSEKVIGGNYTAPLDYSNSDGSGCFTGMKIGVSDIKVNFKNGTDASLFPSETQVSFCLVPQRQTLLEMPAQFLDTFDLLTGTKSENKSRGLHWGSPMFPANEAFDGDITIHLDSGLAVRVANEDYISPIIYVGANASQVIDINRKEILVKRVEKPQVATLGRHFLTAAYLMVNHDSNTFTLWQANPSNKTKLARVLDQKTVGSCEDSDGIIQPPASGTGTLDKSSDSSEPQADLKSSGLPGAVIGGAIAGSIGGATVFGILVFFFLRRRKQKAKSDQSQSETSPISKFDQQHHGQQHQVPTYELATSSSHMIDTQVFYREAPGQSHYAPVKGGEGTCVIDQTSQGLLQEKDGKPIQ